MEEEIWKAVPGYEGYYEVSNMGRVKGLRRQRIHVGKRGMVTMMWLPETIITGAHDAKGYMHVRLSKDGKAHN